MTVTETTETEREAASDRLELGPLFTAGAVLVALGVIRRRKAAIAVGLAAIWADRRTALGRNLRERIKARSTS